MSAVAEVAPVGGPELALPASWARESGGGNGAGRLMSPGCDWEAEDGGGRSWRVLRGRETFGAA